MGTWNRGVMAGFLKDDDKGGQELDGQRGWGRRTPGRGHATFKGTKATKHESQGTTSCSM